MGKLKGFEVDSIWLVGGSALYKYAMETSAAAHIYLTRIHAEFDCDTFFPQIDFDNYVEVNDPDVEREIQHEGNISYNYMVYERKDVGLLSRNPM